MSHISYLLDGAALEVRLRINFHGTGAAMCPDCLKFCQPNDPCFLFSFSYVFSYVINSHILESKTTTRKWVLISYIHDISMSYREKESSPFGRKIRSSVVIMLSLRQDIQRDYKNIGDSELKLWRECGT